MRKSWSVSGLGNDCRLVVTMVRSECVMLIFGVEHHTDPPIEADD